MMNQHKTSDGKIYTFNNIKEVFTPINGKTPWLDGPGFWSNWAVAGYSQGKGLKYLVENGIWYGRAHPVLYTLGNDPYMRTMIYPDWSYIQSELVNGYLYFDWAAMVSDNDYKIEAILYKKNSTPPPPPPSGGNTNTS
ncbi:hypothetical protein ACPVTF_05160 [Geobacillus icigianus]|uniref:hypothetical protein n=1 Tax=Geobacillus TaxID=129337 RepID=UPI00129064C6|nr:hypothetical protein [Geobacillus sp. B4113_201601]